MTAVARTHDLDISFHLHFSKGPSVSAQNPYLHEGALTKLMYISIFTSSRKSFCLQAIYMDIDCLSRSILHSSSLCSVSWKAGLYRLPNGLPCLWLPVTFIKWKPPARNPGEEETESGLFSSMAISLLCLYLRSPLEASAC